MISRKWVNKRIESLDCRFDWEENQLVDDSRVMLIKAGKLDYFESFVTGKYKKGDIKYNFLPIENFIDIFPEENEVITLGSFGIALKLLDIAISILGEKVNTIEIGFPEKEAPFIVRNKFMTLYIAPRVYEKKLEEVVQ